MKHAKKKCILYTWMAMLVMTTHLSGYEIVLEGCNGQTYSMHFDPDTSFKDFIAEIDCSLNALEAEHSDSELLGKCFKEPTVNLRVSDFGMLVHASKKTSQKTGRDYYTPLTLQEKTDIQYIVKTLGNSALPKIMTHETSLNKAGDRIRNIHPLVFLTYVFTDEELKVAMRNLDGKAFVWKKFIDDLAASIDRENAANNLLPYVADFAQKVRIDPSLIMPYLEKGRWKEFVQILIERVPRLGDTARYNM